MKWRDSTLGELIEQDGGVIQTGPFGSQLHQTDYQPEGIPVIMPKDIADGRISAESVARVSEETANRLARHKVTARSIVLPRRGEITKRAFIRPEQQGWLCGTGCLKIEWVAKNIVPEFLYYFMDQGHVAQWLEQHSVGTTMLNLSAGIVADLPVRYPDFQSQGKIADILSAYDDLIENNRRRMVLLEEAARLLYEEWFVRLRFPGHERARFVDGVPEGWGRTNVGTCIDENSIDLQTGPFGTQLRASDYTDAGTPVVNVRNIGYGDLRADKLEFAPDAVVHRLAVHLLQAGDIVFGRKGAVDRHVLIGPAQAGWMQGSDCIRLRALSDDVSPLFLSFAFREPTHKEWMLTQCSNKATMASLNQEVIARIPLMAPSRPVLQAFCEFSSQILGQIANLQRQIEKATEARDLLLPRLMSGEIAV